MKDIVVTGMGVVSTAGFHLKEFWDTLYQGKITYGPIQELIERSDFRIKIGAKINSDSWNRNVPKEILSTYGKAACYCVSAAMSAIQDADINLNKNKKRIAIIIGTTMGEIEVEETIVESIHKDKTAVPEQLYTKLSSFNIVKAVAQATGAQGYMYAVPAACAAGNYAVAMAKQLLEWDYADVVITGGVDAFSKVAFAGFQRLLSLTPDYCRPFDAGRKGLVVGEGAGIIIMEKEGAREGQKCYGRVLGSGLSSNAYHMTSPHENGDGEFDAMSKAIKQSGVSLQDIDYISAHGTGTKANDKIEIVAIKRLFNGLKLPPISSIKSMIGHSMGAASILELIACFLMLQEKVILPTKNCISMDPDCEVDIVDGMARDCNLRYIMSNSFAFGGQTSSIVIGI